MIISRKAKIQEESENMKHIIRDHNNKVLSQPKTIGVLILEDKDFYNYNELGMETAKVVMMNKAECCHVLTKCKKSRMKDANALIVYGNYDGIIFNGRPKNHWYVK